MLCQGLNFSRASGNGNACAEPKRQGLQQSRVPLMSCFLTSFSKCIFKYMQSSSCLVWFTNHTCWYTIVVQSHKASIEVIQGGVARLTQALFAFSSNFVAPVQQLLELSKAAALFAADRIGILLWNRTRQTTPTTLSHLQHSWQPSPHLPSYLVKCHQTAPV